MMADIQCTNIHHTNTRTCHLEQSDNLEQTDESKVWYELNMRLDDVTQNVPVVNHATFEQLTKPQMQDFTLEVYVEQCGVLLAEPQMYCKQVYNIASLCSRTSLTKLRRRQLEEQHILQEILHKRKNVSHDTFTSVNCADMITKILTNKKKRTPSNVYMQQYYNLLSHTTEYYANTRILGYHCSIETLQQLLDAKQQEWQTLCDVEGEQKRKTLSIYNALNLISNLIIKVPIEPFGNILLPNNNYQRFRDQLEQNRDSFVCGVGTIIAVKSLVKLLETNRLNMFSGCIMKMRQIMYEVLIEKCPGQYVISQVKALIKQQQDNNNRPDIFNHEELMLYENIGSMLNEQIINIDFDDERQAEYRTLMYNIDMITLLLLYGYTQEILHEIIGTQILRC